MNTQTRYRTACVLLGIITLFPGEPVAQTLAQRVAAQYRDSVVFLSVKKITGTGDVVEEFGTGFVVSNRGHVLTSCHVVDNKVRDPKGKPLAVTVDKVEVQGAMASRAGTLEKISFLRCSQSGFDLALLRFGNTATKRTPIPVSVHAQPTLGDAIASMGFPLDLEFNVRPGTLGGETADDLYTVDMTLNHGDSGGPVMNASLQAIGVVEAGYTGAGIGIVRPIRHAVVLLTEAGVVFTAVNANIVSAPPSIPAAPKVEIATPASAIQQFAAAMGPVPPGAQSVKVAYPVFKQFSPPDSSLKNPSSTSDSAIAVSNVEAKPGYRIVDAKFIITGRQGVDVVQVSPTGQGSVARAVVKKTNELQFDIKKPAFVTGFIETIQEKIDLPQRITPQR